MAKEKKRKAGAQLGRAKNMVVSKDRNRDEIRIFSPEPEVKEYVIKQVKKLKQSQSLVAGGLLKEGIESRKAKEQ